MKFTDDIKVYGDTSFRGDCPAEDAEHVTFIQAMRRGMPDLAAVMVHPKNEGQRTHGQAAWDKARGMNTGAADFLFICAPPLVIEMKRRDHTKSKWQPGQIEFLQGCQSKGAFVCVALGWEAAFQAVKEWRYLS